MDFPNTRENLGSMTFRTDTKVTEQLNSDHPNTHEEFRIIGNDFPKTDEDYRSAIFLLILKRNSVQTDCRVLHIYINTEAT
jgi:hypothetical protein